MRTRWLNLYKQHSRTRHGLLRWIGLFTSLLRLKLKWLYWSFSSWDLIASSLSRVALFTAWGCTPLWSSNSYTRNHDHSGSVLTFYRSVMNVTWLMPVLRGIFSMWYSSKTTSFTSTSGSSLVQRKSRHSDWCSWSWLAPFGLACPLCHFSFMVVHIFTSQCYLSSTQASFSL